MLLALFGVLIATDESASARVIDISTQRSSSATCTSYPLTPVITADVTDDLGVASVSLSYALGGNAFT